MLTEDGEGSGGWERGVEEAAQFGGGNLALTMKVLQPYITPWMLLFLPHDFCEVACHNTTCTNMATYK